MQPVKYGLGKKNRTDIAIGFLAGSLYTEYSSGVWKGIMASAREEGVGMYCFAGGSIDDPYGDMARGNVIYELARSRRLSGIIVLSGHLANFIGVRAFKDYMDLFSGFPVVSVGIPYDGIPSVTVDNSQGMRESLLHLINVHGAKKIAFISGPEQNPDAEQRYKAFCGVLEEHGIPIDPSLITKGDFTKYTGAHAVSMLIDERKVPFDAIIAANDVMAIDAMDALAARGIKVPEEIAVIGFDDIADCSFITPPLSTVRQPLFRLGYESVKILIASILGETYPKKIVLPTRLIIRRSCNCMGEQALSSSGCADDTYEVKKQDRVSESDSRAMASQFIAHLVSEMENQFTGFNDAITLFNWSKLLVSTFFDDLKTGSGSNTLSVTEKIILEGTEKGIDPILWQHIVGEFYGETCYYKPIDKTIVDNLWKQTLSIIGELVHRINSHQRYFTERESIRMCLLSQDLSTSFRIKTLKENLSQKLHTLGIPAHYIAMYNDSTRTSSRLIAGSAHGKPFSFDGEEIVFPSIDLFPGELSNNGSHASYVVLPLYFRDIGLGFAIFETGPLSGVMYQTLAIQISSALRGADLLEKVEKQAVSLQVEVIEKISDLRNANEKLQEEIIERKKIEEALSQEKERALVTLESIADAVITTDTQGVITYLNPIAEKLTGFSASEANGLPLKRVLNVIYNTSSKDKTSGNPTEIALVQHRDLKLSGTIILKSRDGGVYSIQESIAQIRDRENQTIGAVIVIHNVSETQKMTKEIIYHSSHDNLTGLFNRTKFEEILTGYIETAENEKQEHVMCLIDIDNFRIINDSCGSIAGDELIRHVGSILKSGIRSSDVIARLSGDQFGVLFPLCPTERATRIAEELCRLVNRSTFRWNSRTYKVGVSIGLVAIGEHSESTAKILSASNTACIFAKRRGGGRLFIYEPNDEELARYHNEMYFLTDISKAIEENRFCLFSQVIRPIGKTMSVGEHFEILIRMIDEQGRILAPELFISAAERYNIMPLIDRWAIRKLFSSYKIDYNETLQYSLAKYSLNLSGASLNDEKFLDYVFDQFSEFGIPPFTICFEITETAAISNFTRVITFIKELKRIGCCFALDDFGTGWASFNYLKLLPVDYLKIDGSFVKGIVDNPLDFVLVQTINHIGHVMGLETIAEYVENDAILSKLVEIGVNYAQGYGIARPKLLEI
jgi:diguanylate cyclase (GGDEF)-like protein/PAS domain S-box-containing protein